MLTLLWIGSNNEGFFISDWDRFSSKIKLEARIAELIEEGFSEEDMMVFATDDYMVPKQGKVLV